jgi:predicted Zn-dependent protease
MRLDVVSVPAEQSLPDYLKSGWMDNVEPQNAEEFTINGFPAATITAKGEQWSFRLFAVRFGSDVYRFIFAAKTMTPQIDASFREAIMTFRRMSLKESQEVKPLRLKAVSVGRNDTVASLARRMAVDHALERFRLINGLGPHDGVKPGELVKLVK